MAQALKTIQIKLEVTESDVSLLVKAVNERKTTLAKLRTKCINTDQDEAAQVVDADIKRCMSLTESLQEAFQIAANK